VANGEKTQVRHYVSPSDSANVVDYLIDFFNRPDIPELYSEKVAGIPVKEDKSLVERKRTAEYDRTLSPEGEITKQEILFQPNEDSEGYGRWWYTKKQIPELRNKVSVKKDPRNTILHEAFGHALMDALYGYHKKPHYTRNEVFPYMIQTYSELKRLEEQGVPKTNRSYQKTLHAFEAFRELSKKQLKLEDDR
jgi:hypothetical protein